MLFYDRKVCGSEARLDQFALASEDRENVFFSKSMEKNRLILYNIYCNGDEEEQATLRGAEEEEEERRKKSSPRKWSG